MSTSDTSRRRTHTAPQRGSGRGRASAAASAGSDRVHPSTLLLAAAMLTGAALLDVWTHTEIIQFGYGMSRLQAEQKELSRENEHLRMELQALTTPSRLEQLARVELGLVPPTPEQFVTLDGSTGPLPSVPAFVPPSAAAPVAAPVPANPAPPRARVAGR